MLVGTTLAAPEKVKFALLLKTALPYESVAAALTDGEPVDEFEGTEEAVFSAEAVDTADASDDAELLDVALANAERDAAPEDVMLTLVEGVVDDVCVELAERAAEREAEAERDAAVLTDADVESDAGCEGAALADEVRVASKLDVATADSLPAALVDGEAEDNVDAEELPESDVDADGRVDADGGADEDALAVPAGEVEGEADERGEAVDVGETVGTADAVGSAVVSAVVDTEAVVVVEAVAAADARDVTEELADERELFEPRGEAEASAETVEETVALGVMVPPALTLDVMLEVGDAEPQGDTLEDTVAAALLEDVLVTLATADAVGLAHSLRTPEADAPPDTLEAPVMEGCGDALVAALALERTDEELEPLRGALALAHDVALPDALGTTLPVGEGDCETVVDAVVEGQPLALEEGEAVMETLTPELSVLVGVTEGSTLSDGDDDRRVDDEAEGGLLPLAKPLVVAAPEELL